MNKAKRKILPVFLLLMLGWGLWLGVKDRRVYDLVLASGNSTDSEIAWITKKKAKSCAAAVKLGNYWLDKAKLVIKLYGFAGEPVCQGYGESRVHVVTVEDLEPDADYRFMVRNNQSVGWLVGEFRTAGAREEQPPLPDPAYGQVVSADGVPFADLLVILEVATEPERSTVYGSKGQRLLSRTAENGTWEVDISSIESAAIPMRVIDPVSGVMIETMLFKARHQPAPAVRI